jgi:uncharacterized protein (TIGR02117 family)
VARREGQVCVRLVWRFALALLAVVVCLPVAWLALALVLSQVEGAGDKGEADGAVTVGVMSNGYHASLVLPVSAAGIDWRQVFDPAHPDEPQHDAGWLALGWGDRDFYMQTRKLADMRPATLLRAILGLGDTTVQAIWIADAARLPGLRMVRVSPERYRRMSDVVRARLRRDARGQAQVHAGAGYGANDAFYAAQGRYAPWRTCNEWVADVLRAGSIAVPVWAPLPQALMWSLPQPPHL